MFRVCNAGQSHVSIHLTPWASRCEIHAAEQLADYLNRISGATFKVRQALHDINGPAIIIADLSSQATASLLPAHLAEGLEHDGYRLRLEDDRLYIASLEARGALFGVYEYLRLFCGCHFLDLLPNGETVPRREVIEHEAIDVLDNPACWYRAQQISAHEEPLDRLLPRIDWMAKNGYSHALIHFGGMGDIFDTDPDTPWNRFRAAVMPELERRGLKYTLGHHNFRDLVPPAKYLEEHPEYFALVDGKRQPAGTLEFCMGNRELWDVMADRLIELAKLNPDVDTIALWPSDGVGEPCQAPESLALDSKADHDATNWENLYGKLDKNGNNYGRHGERNQARRYMHMANHVAERLAKVMPKVRLSIIAYVILADPPLDRVRYHDNIIVHLAIYFRDSKHALNDPRSIINRQYVDILNDWLKVVKAQNLLVTTYEAGMNCWKSLPFPIVRRLIGDWEWLKSLGIGGVKSNVFSKQWGVIGLNCHTLSRAMRRQSPDYDTLIAEYCQGFFGEAAEPMRRMYDLWEQRMAEADCEMVIPSPLRSLNALFREEDLDESESLCNEASKLTQESDVQYRIKRVLTLIEYTRINRQAPNEALIRYLMKQPGNTEADNDAIGRWLDMDGDFVHRHMATNGDLFHRMFAEQMKSRWLMEVGKGVVTE